MDQEAIAILFCMTAINISNVQQTKMLFFNLSWGSWSALWASIDQWSNYSLYSANNLDRYIFCFWHFPYYPVMHFPLLSSQGLCLQTPFGFFLVWVYVLDFYKFFAALLGQVGLLWWWIFRCFETLDRPQRRRQDLHSPTVNWSHNSVVELFNVVNLSLQLMYGAIIFFF